MLFDHLLLLLGSETGDSARGVSRDKGDSGVDMMDNRRAASWTMGGWPGEDGGRCICEVGDPSGECAGEKGEQLVVVVVVVVTYECFGF